MSYLVTAMRRAPDEGFTAVNRQTVEGATDLARKFLNEGMQEVEVRDDRGQLLTLLGDDRPSGQMPTRRAAG